MAEPSAECEASDASPRLIAWLAAGIATFLILTPLVLQLLYPGGLHRTVVVGAPGEIPGPRLQTAPARDLALFRRTEDNQLSSYGWINRNRQIVRLPIDRAFALIRERGLPGWPKP
jgi:hypothetical protein